MAAAVSRTLTRAPLNLLLAFIGQDLHWLIRMKKSCCALAS